MTVQQAHSNEQDDDRVYCEDCRFYVVYREKAADGSGYEDSGYGWCHRSAPIPIHRCQNTEYTVEIDPFEHPKWPMVEGTEDWCGEWASSKIRR